MRRGPRKQSRKGDDHRVGRRIRVREVLVIGAEGEQLGVMDTREAMDKAEELGLDLVEMNARASPPVCKIIDYGKYKYEQARKRRESKKKLTSTEIREVKFRPKIGDHDFQVKLKKIREFLGERSRIRLVVQFRGREMVHPEVGKAILDRVCTEGEDVVSVISSSNMEGRNMSMLIGPKKTS